MLAGVTECRRSQKWGCKGRWALGFKPRRGSHRRRGPHGSEGKERGPRSSEEKGRGPRGSGVNRKDHAVLRGKEEDHTVLMKGKRGPQGFGGEGRGSGSFGEVKREPCSSEGKGRGPRGFGVLLFATRLRQQERLYRKGKGRKDSCW